MSRYFLPHVMSVLLTSLKVIVVIHLIRHQHLSPSVIVVLLVLGISMSIVVGHPEALI